MSPSKSNSTVASSVRARKDKKSSPIQTSYLIGYNLASALAWAYVLSLTVRHILGHGHGDGGAFDQVKQVVASQGRLGTALERATTAFDQFGDQVKWVQTAAILEAVHSATRLVRSPLGTTVAQIASRLLIVWYVCIVCPQVPRTPIYVSMVMAWSFAEIIRYLHYATNLMNVKVPVLEWIRYTAFYVLYPVGAGSEATLIYFSAPYAREKFGPLGYFATIGLTLFWPPALAFMMSHMHVQRRKHLGKARRTTTPTTSTSTSSSSTAVAPSTTTAVAPKDVTSKLGRDAIIERTASATPARSTRSRSKIIQTD